MKSPNPCFTNLCSLALAIVLGVGIAAARASEPFPSQVEAASLDGTDGFALRGVTAQDSLGTSVTKIGDLNGDGIDDFALGAPSVDPEGRNGAGAVYVVFGSDSSFPFAMNLSALDGTNGFRLIGAEPGDDLGRAISDAGDFDDDGIEDLLVGADRATPLGREEAGKVYVVYGSTAPFPATLDLASFTADDGIVFFGAEEDDETGRSMAALGDMNGDGIDDIAIGAEYADVGDETGAGKTYVVFGRSGPLPATGDLATIDGSNGFVVLGSSDNDYMGRSVAGLGDMNGDGLGDLAIGAEYADPQDRDQGGEAYVVFGSSTGFPASLSVDALDGSNGFVVHALFEGDRLGESLGAAGDVDGDGLRDLVIGARYSDLEGVEGVGRAYVILGSSAGFPSPFEVSDLNGTNGFELVGANERDVVGASVAGSGDFNGDGIDDLVLGSPGDFGTIDSPGEAWVVFGSRTGFAASMHLVDLEGAGAFRIRGVAASDHCGSEVSSAGDVNADGIDDLLVSAPTATVGGELYTGEAYVVFGRQTCRTGTVDALAAAVPVDVLFVNASAGEGPERNVQIEEGERLWATMIPAPEGGNGRFVVHANLGTPSSNTVADLPFDIGPVCFPLLLDAASPMAVWNGIGKIDAVGASRDFAGQPIADPLPAPSVFLYLSSGDATHLPAGTTVTFQGAITDLASGGTKRVSATNAVILEIVP